MVLVNIVWFLTIVTAKISLNCFVFDYNGQIRAHFSQFIGIGMRRLRAVVTFFLISAKQILKIISLKNHTATP